MATDANKTKPSLKKKKPGPAAGRKKAKVEAEEGVVERATLQVSGLFTKDLQLIMYGFGDVEPPLEDTVALVEEILIEYLQDTVSACLTGTRRGKLHIDDVLFVLRKDPKKFSRVQELLYMAERIKQDRKVIDGDAEQMDA